MRLVARGVLGARTSSLAATFWPAGGSILARRAFGMMCGLHKQLSGSVAALVGGGGGMTTLSAACGGARRRRRHGSDAERPC